jgi:hypothetical protein
MIKHIFIALASAFSLLCITAFIKHEQKHAVKGFAVVELFTSEGCSSCPAADEAVAEMAKQYKENVFILGFHVDYWNHLGWKDVFSKSDYSERQKQYASVFSLNSIYTPQIVVNGKTEFVGSDKSKLQRSISNELNNNSPRGIELSAKETDDKKIVVSISSSVASNKIICASLVQLQGQSNVAKGENEGRLLHHVNIVREFKTIDASKKDNMVYFMLPSGLTKKDVGVIAFTQDKSSLHITDAVATSIQ